MANDTLAQMRVDTGRLRVVAGEALDPVMAEEGEAPSPGAYIKHHRLRRGMSLEQLAMATKIPRSSLVLLEDDRFEELPGMVFAKGFLRCCARTLGLEEDTVLGLLVRGQNTFVHTHAAIGMCIMWF